MDRIAINLAEALQDEISWYHAKGIGSTAYFVLNQAEQVYCVMSVPHQQTENYHARPIVMAHIHEDFVVIDADNTDKPLYERLERAGIPREKIILAYLGETVPNAPHDEPLFPHTEKSIE